ncbi:uncharacterized protein K441DRAFT_651002 [Cenococcum geophilum 1.58]|uniref:uncharacterized protein n=1 Tax=Cenococcum geophilum 1.58 TaxID=794803 RepID=UPI00358FB54C|nr:hypothetical protein K441DRAFT_651002 [Cenococcum geophilum 1.58]
MSLQFASSRPLISPRPPSPPPTLPTLVAISRVPSLEVGLPPRPRLTPSFPALCPAGRRRP